jgi:hypothetical protein
MSYGNVSYDIQYGGVIYPVWSKTENISYDIQYGGVLYPVWSKTDNVSYDIQYDGGMSYDSLLVLHNTG